MNIVVTGANGFIGRNLCVLLSEMVEHRIIEVDKDTSRSRLKEYLSEADFIFHFAGVNRPENDDEFKIGNTDLTSFVVDALVELGRQTPIVLSSSIQVERDNAYGRSKLAAEELLVSYGKKTDARYYIYRFPNVFGKWCRPNYNSFVATFCNNIINDIPVQIHDPNAEVTLVYIDDVCRSLVSLLDTTPESGFKTVQPEYKSTVGAVADMLKAFNNSRETLTTEAVGVGLSRALYSTYLSYFVPKQFSYSIPNYGDERGVFCEMLKTKDSGQFSFFTAHPGITRGGHYHHSKNEKFLVIKGEALFRFQHVVSGERYELLTKGEHPEIVETVPGWSHDVTNIGDEELIVMLWANEVFNRELPDTIAKPL